MCVYSSLSLPLVIKILPLNTYPSHNSLLSFGFIAATSLKKKCKCKDFHLIGAK